MTIHPPDRSLASLEALLGRTRLVNRETAHTHVVTLLDIAAGHVPQLEFMERASELEGNGSFLNKNIIALCSRRAAKTTGICGAMAFDAARHDGVQLYFGRTKANVRLSVWERIWKPLCEQFKFACSHTDGRMVTTFSTGAIVAFTGTDDAAHIETYLGNKLRRAVLDECQSQPPSVIEPLVDRILPPALTEKSGGQMILAGTIPEVPAGKFYEIWTTGDGWVKRNWSRFDNPHMGTREYQLERLAEFLKSSNRAESDSLVRRDWYGEVVFDTSATAYGYDMARNQYAPTEPAWLAPLIRDSGLEHVRRTIRPSDGTARHGVMAAVPLDGIEVFAAAIDPGARDRFSISVHGWGSGTEVVQHVFEFSSKRKANLKWSQVMPLVAAIQEHYHPSWWYYDAGGSKVVLDGFHADSGLPALQPAVKGSGSLHGQVQRVADLMLTGRLKVMAGSAAEEDYQKARWDPDARAKLQWAWAPQWHPDPSESSRYSLAPYFELYEEPAPERPREEVEREAHELAMRRLAARRKGTILDEDMDAAAQQEEDERWD